MAGRKQRDGLFPATACIKLAGVYGTQVQIYFNDNCNHTFK